MGNNENAIDYSFSKTLFFPSNMIIRGIKNIERVIYIGNSIKLYELFINK